MLQRLLIKNYAIIDEIEICFSGNLNIITGETGAGKSILMGALSLILGERADTSVLLDTGKKCIVEGHFTIDGKRDVVDFLKDNELDFEETVILRREVAVNGKSRAFINDTPTNLQQLKELASLLVDLHQQFDTLELGDAGFQREVLDALAANNDKLVAFKQCFTGFQQASRELRQLQEEKANFNKELDYYQFLFNELDEISLKENELEELDNELRLLTNAEGIKTALSRSYYDLEEGEQPVIQVLKQIVHMLNGYAGLREDIASIIQRIESTHIELRDIAQEIDRINDAVHFDEKRIDVINGRLSAGYKLLKKHNVKTTADLLEIQQQLLEKLQAVLNLDDVIVLKEKELKTRLHEVEVIAEDLSKARQKQSAPLTAAVNNLLKKVGMPNARLKIDIAQGSLNETGKDRIDFLFDGNNSNHFEPLRKVASGGELSRLMLCLKSLVAQSVDLPTLIFDEIDTGISGEAAKQVGNIMKQLSTRRQVICITHQPQIAGKADAHFFVFKEAKGNVVKTKIKLLTTDERVSAIAQMLGGEKPSAAALQNAKEMVMN